MRAVPCRTVGVEVELLAPVNSNRRELAEFIARRIGGTVTPYFHIDSEPSKVAGKPVFYHLTQAYRVTDANGELVAKCVDDITLQRDLNKKVPPKPGWYRILSDDIRLLRLLERHTSPEADIAECLQPLGELFGTSPQSASKGIYRLMDEGNASLAMAAPLPSERERACEIVTAPLAADDRTTLPLLLGCASELGFTLPNEGATHLHFDGQPFCSAAGLATTMNMLHAQHDALRHLVQTNPYCRRTGRWPDEVMQIINDEEFVCLDWEQARQRLLTKKPGKYFDFNIRNLIHNISAKHTLEVRNLPATLDSDKIFTVMDAFQALFAHTLNPQNQQTKQGQADRQINGQTNGQDNQQQLPASVVAAF